MEMPYSIYHLRANRILPPSLLSKSVALCYRKYGDSNLIIYTHRTSWMISSYSTPPPPFYPRNHQNYPLAPLSRSFHFTPPPHPLLQPFVLRITHNQSIPIQTENQDSSYLYGNYNLKISCKSDTQFIHLESIAFNLNFNNHNCQ